jgi:hypothetical protein
MINLLANKLPSLPDRKNLIWKNSDEDLYKKFSQYDKPNNASSASSASSASPALPTLSTLKNAPQLSEISEISEISNNVRSIPSVPTEPNDVSRINKIPRVLKVSPIKIFNDNANNVDVHAIPTVAKAAKQLNPIKETKKNVKKPNPIDTILAESSTCDIYKSDVKEKLIALITSNEFSKVFGITKSSEIMSGIVNERVNKSIAIFISFLFDKCVIYNDKEFIFNKNKETVGTITI